MDGNRKVVVQNVTVKEGDMGGSSGGLPGHLQHNRGPYTNSLIRADDRWWEGPSRRDSSEVGSTQSGSGLT